MFKRFGKKLKSFFSLKKFDEKSFEELEDLLIEGDLGPRMAMEISDKVREQASRGDTSEMMQQSMKEMLSEKIESRVPEITDGVNLFLILGVNGVGKTTTIAKLANYYKRKGVEVMLCAGDTFRAAAIDQLQVHADRLKVRMIRQQMSGDPGAVVYDAISSAQSKKGPVLLLVDTAGRMHTRENLVRELGKIDKVIRGRGIDDEHYKKFIVIDATTGQNGFSQTEQFNRAVPIDGVILTKYDSLSKGGALVRIGESMHIPIAFVGTGEGYEDLELFDKEKFLNSLTGIQ